MSDILDETRNYLECGECPWYKLCVSPMRFTAEDIRRQISSQPGINQPNDAATQELMAKMAAAHRIKCLKVVRYLSRNCVVAQNLPSVSKISCRIGMKNKALKAEYATVLFSFLLSWALI